MVVEQPEQITLSANPVGTMQRERTNNMSTPSREDELENYKIRIIDNLSDDDEDTLRNIHAEQYTGLDDDMVEDYNKWLMELTVMDLEAYLDIDSDL